ncbi:MAG: Ig-like domain-containing protein [bacterium]|nr:Ig-like domain-containing protein [bacterium]
MESRYGQYMGVAGTTLVVALLVALSALPTTMALTPPPPVLLPLYSDTIAAGWFNTAFGGAFDVSYSTSPYRGTRSIRATTDPWGAVGFTTLAPVRVDRYRALEFAVRPSGGSMTVAVVLQGSQGVSPLVRRTVPPDVWTAVAVSIPEFGLPATFAATKIFVSGGDGTHTWQLDEVRFVGEPVIGPPPIAGGSTTLDTVPPTVFITAPRGGTTVTGTVAVTAAATDNIAVAGVQFKLDGTNLGREATTSPFSVRWNMASSSNGRHTLTAVAQDRSGNRTLSQDVSVFVENRVATTTVADRTPPSVSIASPQTGSTVLGLTTVRVIATDPPAGGPVGGGVARVEVYANNRSFGSKTEPPYEFVWSTSGVSGTSTLFARATDRAGNSATSTPVTIFVSRDIVPPSIRILPLPLFATGTLIVSATGTDNVAIAGVQWKLDGTNLGSEDTSAPFSVSWETLKTDNGNHTLQAVARDAAGNVARSAGVPVSVGNTVPVPDTVRPFAAITGPKTFSPIATATIVTATATDNIAVVGVQFKLDGTNIGSEHTSAPWGVQWDARKTDNGSHTLQAVARDKAGNVFTSAAITVRVEHVTAVPDTSAPSIRILPLPLFATGTLIVSATGTDNVAIAGVQWKLDGTSIGAEDTGAPFSVVWDTLKTNNGNHTLQAVARDAAGNVGRSGIVTASVRNAASVQTATSTDRTPPQVALIAPRAGVMLIATTTFRATATDTIGVVSIQFKLDGTNFGAEDMSAPYEVVWDTRMTENGGHAIIAVARDAAGNVARTVPITVPVQNVPLPPDLAPPTIFLTAPSAGDALTGTTTLVVVVNDDRGVLGVQFRLDGTDFMNEVTKPPFSLVWDTRVTTNGIHRITALIRDAGGNRATSNPVSISVLNVLTVPDTSAPTIRILPLPLAATGTLMVSATGTDNVAIAGVQWKLDGTNLGAEDVSAPFSVVWDTTKTDNGNHTLQAVARDAAGNVARSAGVTLTIRN